MNKRKQDIDDGKIAEIDKEMQGFYFIEGCGILNMMDDDKNTKLIGLLQDTIIGLQRSFGELCDA